MSLASKHNSIISEVRNSILDKMSRLPKESKKCYLKWNDGSKYIGECTNKHLNGYGVYTFPDKSTYQGYWKKSCKHGMGVLKYNNGNIYKGDFVNDTISGEGVLIYNVKTNSKQIYVGEFFNNMMNGYGKSPCR